MPSVAFPAVVDAPLWRGIASAIERAITTGSLPVGSRIPGEHELAGSFGASRHTIVRAVRHLAAHGLVERRQGIGTFVTTAHRIPPTTTLQILAAEALVLTPTAGPGPLVHVTAAARGAVVGRFRVALSAPDWKTGDELADLGVLAGTRGWTGCRRRTRIDLAPAADGPTAILRIRTDIADDFTGRTCSITARLSSEVFSVELERPLETPFSADSGIERTWY